MRISDTTTRTVTIALEGAEIADIETIVRGYLAANPRNGAGVAPIGTAKNILKSLEVD
jgi:hypothetical protein